MSPRLRRHAPDAVLSVVLALLVLGPLEISRGFALRGDMVFVPHAPWKGAYLGLDGSVPRSVPMDAVIWLLDQLAPGDLVQKAILLVALVVGGLGAARMVAPARVLPRAAVIIAFVWNPWVYERLAIGQWACVVGYALLPWMVLASVRLRERRPHGWAACIVLLGLSAVCAPSVGLVALLTCTAVVVVRPRWRALVGLWASGLAVNLPWLVPSLLSPGGITASDAQFSSFAARAESSLGVWASLLSLGGIWKTSIVPPERTMTVIVLLSCLVTVIALSGLRIAVRANDRRTILALGLVAGVSFALAALPTIGWVGTGLGHLSTVVPGAGILRDSNRYLAPVVLLLLPGLAAAVGWLQDQIRPGREALLSVVVLVVLLPILCLPSMAWGLHGRLAPVRYPAEWSSVAADLQSGKGSTVVLPWTGSYRGFAWNRHQAVLDPAPRYFAGDVLVDDRVFLNDRVLPSEDDYLKSVGAALTSPDASAALRALGVGRVLVEKGNGVDPGQVPSGRVVHDGPLLMLVDLGQPADSVRARPPAGWVLASDLIALLMVLFGVALIWRRSM